MCSQPFLLGRSTLLGTNCTVPDSLHQDQCCMYRRGKVLRRASRLGSSSLQGTDSAFLVQQFLLGRSNLPDRSSRPPIRSVHHLKSRRYQQGKASEPSHRLDSMSLGGTHWTVLGYCSSSHRDIQHCSWSSSQPRHSCTYLLGMVLEDSSGPHKHSQLGRTGN